MSYLLDPEFVSKRQERFGPVFRTHLFGAPTVVVVSPELSRFILATHPDWFPQGWPAAFLRLFEGSIAIQDGAEHARTRSALMPVFHGPVLADYIAVIERHTQRYLERWLRLGQFDWLEQFRQLTFDIVCELFLGWQPGDAKTAKLSSLYKTYFNGIYSIPVDLPWSRFGKAVRAQGELWDALEDLLRQRMDQPANDLLGKLVQARDETGQPLSIAELKKHAVAFVTGGHETTTSVLTSLVYALARHPAIVTKLCVEQARVPADGAFTLDQLREMTYLEHTIWEAERLYPPANGGFRRAAKTVELGGYTIPAGWRVHYRIPEVHLDPAIYTQPKTFDPDRFASGRAEHKKQASGFLPYGIGERSCLGISMARLIMKIVLARIVRTMSWQLVEEQVRFVHLPTLHVKALRVQVHQATGSA